MDSIANIKVKKVISILLFIIIVLGSTSFTKAEEVKDRSINDIGIIKENKNNITKISYIIFDKNGPIKGVEVIEPKAIEKCIEQIIKTPVKTEIADKKMTSRGEKYLFFNGEKLIYTIDEIDKDIIKLNDKYYRIGDRVEDIMDIILKVKSEDIKDSEIKKYNNYIKEVYNGKYYTINTNNVACIRLEYTNFFDRNINIDIDKQNIINTFSTYVKDMQEFREENMMKRTLMEGIISLINKNGIEKQYPFKISDDTGYIEMEGITVKMCSDLIRFVEATEYIKDGAFNISKDAEELFEKYRWHITYKYNAETIKLPKDFNYHYGEDINKLYWAYNNELSNSIGLDINPYLGKDIEVEMYRLDETARFLKDDENDVRGVILRYKGKIIGAYCNHMICRNTRFSLNRGIKCYFEYKESFRKWVDKYIDYNDNMLKEATKLSKEEVIKQALSAVNEKNIKHFYTFTDLHSLYNSLIENYNNRYEVYKGREMKFPRTLIATELEDECFKHYSFEPQKYKKIDVLDIKKIDTCNNIELYEVTANITGYEKTYKSEFLFEIIKVSDKLGYKIVY
jgi:hypothetical protein